MNPIKDSNFQELHQHALDVQDACNLSGVVHSFSNVMRRLWVLEKDHGGGSDWVNSNAVTRLFASKILHLAQEAISDDWDIEKQKTVCVKDDIDDIIDYMGLRQ
jgi:hypothetical protein